MLTMTIGAPQLLDYHGRLRATCKGSCIGGRDTSGYKVLAFSARDFYVEVYYRTKHNYITRFHAFDGIDLPEPYLEKISLVE